MRISKRLFKLETETAFTILAKANKLQSEGKNIINLGIGQPDFLTPKNIVEAAIKALRDGHHGYTPSNGIIELREAVSKHIYKNYNSKVSPDNILITPGGKPIIFFATLIFGEHNAEIIYPDPGFPIYRSMIKYSGAKPVPLLLKEKNNLKLTVLTGHNMTSASQFEKLESQFKSLNLPGPLSNMAKTLWEHEMVVCAGGITLHEAIAVGTPAFVISQTEHQQSKARFVENSGAAINLGMGGKSDIEKLLKALNSSRLALETMSSKGKELIDGHGIFRVTDAITELIKK